MTKKIVTVRFEDEAGNAREMLHIPCDRISSFSVWPDDEVQIRYDERLAGLKNGTDTASITGKPQHGGRDEFFDWYMKEDDELTSTDREFVLIS